MNWVTSWFRPLDKAKIYDTHIIEGLSYRVERRKLGEDRAVAMTLHHLNMMGIRIIGYIRRFIVAGRDGKLRGHDKNLPLEQLGELYERLRTGYHIDEIYESLRRHDGTSYVINNGEEIHFCIRGDHPAVLATVLVHEMAHIGSSTPDHDEEFWNNYEILRAIVRKMGIITADMIPKSDRQHCGRVPVTVAEMEALIADEDRGNDDADWRYGNITPESPQYRPPQTTRPLQKHHSRGTMNVRKAGSLYSKPFIRSEYSRWIG